MFSRCARRSQLLGQLVFGGFWLGVTGFGLYLNPSKYGHGTHQELGLPPCPSVLLFNRPCPGCGLTTSFTALLHGQFGEAFHAHPLGPFLYAVIALAGIASLYGFITKQRFDTYSKGVQRFLTVFVVIFVSFGIFRFATTPHYQTPYEHAYAQLHG